MSSQKQPVKPARRTRPARKATQAPRVSAKTARQVAIQMNRDALEWLKDK